MDREHAVEVLFLHFLQGRTQTDSGDVDQDVKSAEGVDRGFGHVLGVGFFADVGLDEDSF